MGSSTSTCLYPSTLGRLGTPPPVCPQPCHPLPPMAPPLTVPVLATSPSRFTIKPYWFPPPTHRPCFSAEWVCIGRPAVTEIHGPSSPLTAEFIPMFMRSRGTLPITKSWSAPTAVCSDSTQRKLPRPSF